MLEEPPPFRSWQARKGLHEAHSKVREEGDELHRKIGCVLYHLHFEVRRSFRHMDPAVQVPPLRSPCHQAAPVGPRARTLRVLMIGLPP